MRSRGGWCTILLGVLAAGCVAVEPPAADIDAAADTGAGSPAVFELAWPGHVTSDVTMLLSHSRPQADLLTTERVGFSAEVPNGTREVEVVVRWDGPARLDLYVHTPHEHDTGQMGTYTQPDPVASPNCGRIPLADVAPGKWEFMSRNSLGAAGLDFTITVIAVGGAPTLLDEPHGHNRVRDLQDGRNDDLREFEACRIFQP